MTVMSSILFNTIKKFKKVMLPFAIYCEPLPIKRFVLRLFALTFGRANVMFVITVVVVHPNGK